MSITLDQVKAVLGISGDYQNNTLQPYFDEVMDFIEGAGVSPEAVTAALVARGISDLWNYDSAGGQLSPYFIQRVTQLSAGGDQNDSQGNP